MRCGRVVRLSFQSLLFPAHRMTHCTCSWDVTDRLTLAAYCIGTVNRLSNAQLELLEHYGFCPCSRILGSGESSS